MAKLAKRQLHLTDGQKVFDGIPTAETVIPGSPGVPVPPPSSVSGGDVYSVDNPDRDDEPDNDWSS